MQIAGHRDDGGHIGGHMREIKRSIMGNHECGGICLLDSIVSLDKLW